MLDRHEEVERMLLELREPEAGIERHRFRIDCMHDDDLEPDMFRGDSDLSQCMYQEFRAQSVSLRTHVDRQPG